MPCEERECTRENYGHGYFKYANGHDSDEFCSRATGLALLKKEFGDDAEQICRLACTQMKNKPLAPSDDLVDPRRWAGAKNWNEMVQIVNGNDDDNNDSKFYQDRSIFGATAHDLIAEGDEPSMSTTPDEIDVENNAILPYGIK
jgi:hypothetical protein